MNKNIPNILSTKLCNYSQKCNNTGIQYYKQRWNDNIVLGTFNDSLCFKKMSKSVLLCQEFFLEMTKVRVTLISGTHWNVGNEILG